jgi:hypothetical protein
MKINPSIVVPPQINASTSVVLPGPHLAMLVLGGRPNGRRQYDPVAGSGRCRLGGLVAMARPTSRVAVAWRLFCLC